MINPKRPESIERINKILKALQGRTASSPEIAAEIGISSALARHYLQHLAQAGHIQVVDKTKIGGRITYFWGAILRTPEVFYWTPRRPPQGRRPEAPAIATSWIGGNPYERLAA